jgi:hypothetical protein
VWRDVEALQGQAGDIGARSTGIADPDGCIAWNFFGAFGSGSSRRVRLPHHDTLWE